MQSLNTDVDDMLLQVIRQNPGLSMYELAKLLKWSIGKTDGSVRRLTNSNKVQICSIERNGRRVTLVYPKSRKSFDETVEVPKKLLTIGNPLWKDNGYVYALDDTNIGITGKPFSQWQNNASFREKVKLVDKKDHFALKIPQRFVAFYHLQDKHLTKTVNGNRLILTIDGRLISHKSYPAKRSS